MTRLALIFLTGCTAPQFTDPVYLNHEKPGPVAQAGRNAQFRALDDAHAQQVKRAERQALSKAFREHARTNYLAPPLPENFANHPRNEKASQP